MAVLPTRFTGRNSEPLCGEIVMVVFLSGVWFLIFARQRIDYTSFYSLYDAFKIRTTSTGHAKICARRSSVDICGKLLQCLAASTEIVFCRDTNDYSLRGILYCTLWEQDTVGCFPSFSLFLLTVKEVAKATTKQNKARITLLQQKENRSQNNAWSGYFGDAS